MEKILELDLIYFPCWSNAVSFLACLVVLRQICQWCCFTLVFIRCHSAHTAVDTQSSSITGHSSESRGNRICLGTRPAYLMLCQDNILFLFVPLVLTSFHMSFGQTYLLFSTVATDRLPIKMLTVLNIHVISLLLPLSLFPLLQFSALQCTISC
jgi:hypothetical protein